MLCILVMTDSLAVCQKAFSTVCPPLFDDGERLVIENRYIHLKYE
jgi:hypothetical protein